MTALEVHLLGFTAANAHKLLWSAALIGAAVLLRYGIVWIVRLATGEHPNERTVF